jgi:DNA-binding CsgD family transcriptional regulator
MDELIRSATINDFKRGYIWEAKKARFLCLICGGCITENEENISNHMAEHGTPMQRLLLLDKKYTGLTEIQKEFLEMVSKQYNDKEIALKLGCAESTVRNMRFALRERARQARAFLAVIELAEEKMPKISNSKLRIFPIREAKRKALLPRFADLFEPNRDYTEIEVKKIIKTIYDDDATIRRYLVDYKYLSRTADGSRYYKNCEVNTMDITNKKELINKYKQQEIEMGIIQIYNTVNGYSYVDICTNLYKPFESIKFQLNLGKVKMKKLQEDWIAYGENAFEFRVVEKLKPNEGGKDKKSVEELKELLHLWIESQGENLKLYK